MRHDRTRISAEQPEQFLEQACLHRGARRGGFEDVRIAYLPGAAHRAFDFEPVHHGLYRGVGGPVFLDHGFVDLADGKSSAAPEFAHDAQLECAQLRFGHKASTTTTAVDSMTAVVASASATSRNSRIPTLRWARRRCRLLL